jgi:adenylate cyclase
LPFTNMSNDPEQEYFGDGITEDITADLSKLSGFFVIARNSAFTYKGKAVKVQEISREMGVRYVLEGSVRKAGEQVRVTAQLIDGPSGGHVWSGRYDRPLTDIFAVQDEIVQQLVTTLRVEVMEAEMVRVRRIPTENLTAYDYYLRGVESFFRAATETNQAAHSQARQMFEKAIELDPMYAEAYMSLSSTYRLAWIWQWSQDPQTLDRALELAQKAIALDDSLSFAHSVLSWVYWGKGQFEQALAEGERAIILDPNNADGYAAQAETLSFADKPEEAVRLMEKAMRLNPHYPVWYLVLLGRAYHIAGRYEDEVATLKSALTRSPNNFGAHAYLAAAYIELGREAEARTEAAEAQRLNPQFSLEVWRQRAPYKDPAVLERTLAALRKAGLK